MKTTMYFPEEMKAAIERTARERNCSEADVVRQAVAKDICIERPRARGGFLEGPPMAERVDELLEELGFGDWRR